jgi:uncharacterized YigZ family protein
MQTLSFNTLAQKATSIIKVKGSKFIGISFPCKSQEEFKKELQIIQNEYPDARHFCYAYRLSDDGTTYKFNDDGEPTNSAGKPILGQLAHFEITYSAVVVVRYFGGTKLGVGGLIKAFKETAKEAINANKINNLPITKSFRLSFSYAQMNQVMKIIKNLNLNIANQDLNIKSTIDIQCPLNSKEKFENQLNNNRIAYEII